MGYTVACDDETPSRSDVAATSVSHIIRLIWLDKENTYILNVQQQDYEIIDYTIGGQENEINILQSQ